MLLLQAVILEAEEEEVIEEDVEILAAVEVEVEVGEEMGEEMENNQTFKDDREIGGEILYCLFKMPTVNVLRI